MWADDKNPPTTTASEPTPEPLAAESTIPSSVAAAFAVFDKDGSGSLSIDELRAVLKDPAGGAPLSDEAINQIIAEFDTDGDGNGATHTSLARRSPLALVPCASPCAVLACVCAASSSRLMRAPTLNAPP